jgi:hypothetical protein
MISEKSFLYGTLIWLWAEAGLPHGFASVGVSLSLLACSSADAYLPGRVAETTDAVIGLLLGSFMVLFRHCREGSESASQSDRRLSA